MLTQTFTYKNEPFKLADFSIINKAIYNIDISNVRLENGKLVANVNYTYDNYTTVNNQIAALSSGRSPHNADDIAKLVNDPVSFFKHFDWIDKHPTDLAITFKVDTPAKDAPQEVKDFYNNKLSSDAVKGFAVEIEKELAKRKTADAKIEGELKQTLTKNVLMSYRFAHGMDLFMAFIFAGIAVSVFLPGLIFASTIAMSWGLPLAAVQGFSVVGLLTAPFAILKEIDRTNKSQAIALKKLGELDGENTDSNENKLHLIHKLGELTQEKGRSANINCETAINIGQKSYSSYFEQFKSFFTPVAYHPGYHVGQEMAAKKGSKPI